MIIVKPSKDILQLNRGFRFERNSSAFDEEGNLFLPHNARFLQGKFGKALLVEEGTSNLIPYGFARWNNNGGWLDLVRHSDWDYDIICSLDAKNYMLTYTVYSILPSTEYTYSVYFDHSNITNLMMYLRDVCNAVNSKRHNITDLGRYQVSLVFGIDVTYAMVYIQSFSGALKGQSARVKFPQLEIKPYATTFIHGVRSNETVTIPITTLTPAQGQIDHYAYINDMARRQVVGQTPTLFHIPRQDGGMGIRVCHAEDTANWKLQTMDDTNDITEVDAPDSLTPDGWHRFTVKWTEAEAKLLIDGVVAGTIANPALPSVFAQDAYVGSYDGNEDFLNTLHDDIRVSNIARADADDLTDYQADQPLPTDEYTIYKQSFDSPNDMYVRQGFVL